METQKEIFDLDCIILPQKNDNTSKKELNKQRIDIDVDYNPYLDLGRSQHVLSKHCKIYLSPYIMYLLRF